MSNKLYLVNIFESDSTCIDSVSFSPCGQFVSASHSNSISIYHVSSRIHLTTIHDSDKNASFRSLIWVPKNKGKVTTRLADYRLITIGLHAIVSDWDLETLQQTDSSSSYGGAIFSAALSYCKSYILIACDDGSVRRISLWDKADLPNRKSQLQFEKVYVRHTKSILSVCILPDGSFFCGTLDSLIFMCDNNTDEPVCKIKVSSKRKPLKRKRSKSADELEVENDTVEEIVNSQIWALVYLFKHNLLVSGDSLGNVILWDIESCTMTTMFNQHDSDVLALAVANDSDTFFSAGIDSKITIYSFNKKNYQNCSTGWNVNGVRYLHRGDIRCLAINPFDDSIASAGTDGLISISKGIKFLNYRHSKSKFILLNVPSWIDSGISMDHSKNLVLCKYQYHCDMWFIPSASERDNSDDLTAQDESSDGTNSLNDSTNYPKKPYKIATIKLNEDGGKIKAVALSPNGDLMVVANNKGFRIFYIDTKDLKISQIKVDHAEIKVSAITFISNNEIIISHYSEKDEKFVISLYNISDGNLSLFEPTSSVNKHVIKFSNYGAFGVTKGIACYTIDSSVYIVDIEGNYLSELPEFDNGWKITCVTVSPDGKYLVAFCNAFRYYFYDLVEKKVIPYDNNFIHRISHKVTNNNAMIYNAVWLNLSAFGKIIVHTTNSILSIKLEQAPFFNTSSGNISSTVNGLSKTQSSNIVRRMNKVYIGPRRLYNAPSIEHCLYKPPSLQKRDDNRTSDTIGINTIVHPMKSSMSIYTCIIKTKFIVHMDLLVNKNNINIIAFHVAPPENSIFHRKRYGM